MNKFSEQDILDFMMVHHPRLKKYDNQRWINWIAWNIKERFCLVVGTEQGMTGVAFIRPVMDVDLADTDGLYSDIEGDTYFIDLAVAISPLRKTLQALMFGAMHRFGERTKMARRTGRGGVAITDFNRHRRLLLREVKHHGIK